MRSPDDLIEGYRRFRTGAWLEEEARYRELSHGQNPAVMIIACADSRCDPATIFNARPGELFTLRNVANLVPPFEENGLYHGTSAALEFAVTDLQVEHIVIMGHAHCGGIRACLAGAGENGPGGFIKPWVSLINTARDTVLDAMPGKAERDRELALEHLAIRHSLDNLMTFPFVRAAIEQGRLNLHGSWFSIASGELHWLDQETGRFAPVDS